MKDTPGPWEVVPATEHHGFYVVGSWGQTICDFYTMSNPSLPSTRNGGESYPIGFSANDDEGNARLTAAAPDLVQALSSLLAVAEMTTFSDQYPAECEAARAALAKAGVA